MGVGIQARPDLSPNELERHVTCPCKPAVCLCALRSEVISPPSGDITIPETLNL